MEREKEGGREGEREREGGEEKISNPDCFHPIEITLNLKKRLFHFPQSVRSDAGWH